MGAEEGRTPRICCFDIETTDLRANFGRVLCVSWKWVGEDKIHTISITKSPHFDTQPWDDKYVVRAAAEELSKADALVSWYGIKFDVPFLQTRLLYHGLQPLPPIPHIDGWRTARYKMKMSSNRMMTVADFFEADEKTPVSGEIWVKASCGHRPSMRYIIDHCERDVRMLERVYLRIRPLIQDHPSLAVISGVPDVCRNCASHNLQKRGFHITKTNRYQRYQCRNCGTWSRGRNAMKTPPVLTI